MSCTISWHRRAQAVEAVEAPAPVANVVAVDFGGDVAQSDDCEDLAAELEALNAQREELERKIKKARAVAALRAQIEEQRAEVARLAAELAAI